MGSQVLFYVLLRVRRRAGRVGCRGDSVHGDIRRVRRGQRVHCLGRAQVPGDAHRHQLLLAQSHRRRSAVRRHHASAGLRPCPARLAVRRFCVPAVALFAVCLRFRAAVDADADQHGPASVHRRAAVPIAADASPCHRTHRAHVADRAGGVHASAVLVPRAGRDGRHSGERVHAGVPQERHVQNVHRVYRVRGILVLHPTAVAIRLPLPEDISQVEQDPTADRALGLASVHRRPHCVAEQSVAAHQRFHTTGFGASRRAPVQEARASGARAADQRDRGAGDVAADHRRDVPDLRRRQPGHGGHGLLPALTPLHHGPAVRAAQHRRQPHPVRRAVRELPQVFRPAVVHIEAPAGHAQGTVGQRQQVRRPDAQQRPLQLDPATGKFGVRGRASGHRDRVVVRHQRVLVMRAPPPTHNIISARFEHNRSRIERDVGNIVNIPLNV